MAQQSVRQTTQSGPQPTWGRSLELRDPAAQLGAAASAPRVVIDTGALAQLVHFGEGSAARWSTVRAMVWERSLKDSNLLGVLYDPAVSQSGAFNARLREIRDNLEHLKALEQRLGEDAEEDVTVARSELDNMVILLSAIGVMTAFAPSELRPLVAAGLCLFGARSAWRQFGPRATVGRAQLSQARVALARSIQSLLEHSWVAALGENVVESCPHAVYFACRLQDLETARGLIEQRRVELRTLSSRISEANASLGRDREDAETRRLGEQVEELSVRLGQVDRVRAECEAASQNHLAQLDRQRAIAARRALSSRVASAVDSADDSREQALAMLEVDIAGLAARIRALDVATSDADLELRAVLEVSGATASRASTVRNRG